jgi:hypothetical protein
MAHGGLSNTWGSGTISEIAEDKVNGFLTSKEPTEIVTQIDTLFVNSALRLASGISALESTALSSNKNDMALKHLSLYIKDVRVSRE